MDSSVETAVSKNTYFGLFLVTLSTMMYELLLTRVFSVLLFYHGAFMAVSMAMFGMTAGATAVYFWPKFFAREKTAKHLFWSTLLFSLTTVLSFWLVLSLDPGIQFASALAISFTYSILSVPFVFSGIAVCLALTRFPSVVGKMYAVDLAGAAIGCLVVVALLGIVDGPTAVIWVAQITALGALFFASEAGKKMPAAICGIWLALATVLALTNPMSHLVSMKWSKGIEPKDLLFEKWNCFSRVRVYGDPEKLVNAFGWGMSSAVPPEDKVRQLQLDIDSFASTALTKFNGDLESVRALRFDLTNLVHYVRPNSDVMVIGAGGGRDILSALIFGQKSVTAAEINPSIFEAVNGRFGDFTGHLDRNPRVHLVNEEARSFLAGNKQKFDIIQISLVDTWAASSAGAFSLTENGLYTREAWHLFLSRLSDDGILSCARWYTRSRPGETYRTLALAMASLKDLGITDVRKHLALVRFKPDLSKDASASGVGCLLVSKSPFTEAQLKALDDVCREKRFELVLSPDRAADPELAKLVSADSEKFIAEYPLCIDAPTDDKPFFFQMVRFKDWLNSMNILDLEVPVAANSGALFILGVLFLLVIGLSSVFILAPLVLLRSKLKAPGTLPLLLYFSSIGLGYIIIEIVLIQRLNMFLGVPIYGLSVSLFTLLLSSAAGSELFQFCLKRYPHCKRYFLLALPVVLILSGLSSELVLTAFTGSPIALRILVAVARIVPLGLVMGTAFPLGMDEAAKRTPEATPWFWGVNGALSVCGSVLAVTIAIGGGLTCAYMTGVGSYLLALIAFYCTSKRPIEGA